MQDYEISSFYETLGFIFLFMNLKFSFMVLLVFGLLVIEMKWFFIQEYKHVKVFLSFFIFMFVIFFFMGYFGSLFGGTNDP